jgi:hypothetical protein
MRGECHVDLADRDRSDAMAKACAFIPIRFANETIAVLAILRLLPQKLVFDGSDMELFKVLSHEAGEPLFGPRAGSQASSRGTGING